MLLNIVLDGMEQALGVSYNKQGTLKSRRAVVRYADDFVVFCESEADAQQAQRELVEWLNLRGLEFSLTKTQIVHLKSGFDFLGFNVRHYPAPKSSRSGWKLLIKPSKAALKKVKQKLKAQWLKLRGSNVETVIARLNPIIRGQAHYYRRGVASAIFSKLDYWQWQRAVRYAKYRHANKAYKWLRAKYWGRLNLDRADHNVFGDKSRGKYLLKFSWFKIEYPILVRGRASPDDPALKAYWQAREAAKKRDLSPSK